MCTVKEKGGKADRKPYPLPNSLRTPYRNLKYEKLSRLCPETSTKFYVHEFGFWTLLYTLRVRIARL
jgi:hypothetical protein